MSVRDRFRPCEFPIARIAREIARRETREFWRELAEPVTFFDVCSPSDVGSIEISEFVRKSAPGKPRTCPGSEGRCSIQLVYGRT